MCPSRWAPELWLRPGGELSPSRRGACVPQAALESQGEKVKEEQTPILFKAELSSNLCSPKMELADCRGKSVLAELVAICQGRGSGPAPSTQHPAPGGAGGVRLLMLRDQSSPSTQYPTPCSRRGCWSELLYAKSPQFPSTPTGLQLEKK